MAEPIAQNCKCANCSQGFCHFCKPRETNVVTPIKEHERYNYLPGCGRVRLPYKFSDGHVEASACPSHNKKGAK
jgi:hypothetical protein